MQITYPITYFPSNWNILTFFTTFRFDSFHFILFCASWVLSYEVTLSKEKKFWETLCLQPPQFVSILLHLHLYANYCSSAGFCWRQKCWFWIPRCLPFWAPFIFWLSRFYKLSFRLFIPTFNARKLWEMLQLIKVTQHALRLHNLTFLISFVLLLSPKQ